MRGERRGRPHRDWSEWYALAAQYRAGHGDLLVPKDYACPGGEKLGRWIENQRAKHNHFPPKPKRGGIEPWQIEALERIGMVWKLEDRRERQKWLEMLDRYKAVHGSADVPHEYELEGFRLGNWLHKQRQRYSAGTLTPQEIDELEERGVNWKLRTRPRSWEDWYADAERYYRQYGDLRVKQDYRTPAGDRLGIWIYGQRDRYAGRKKSGSLTPERVERLSAIGMIWDPVAARMT